MQVHDELVLEVPDGELARVRGELPRLMTDWAKLRVPLAGRCRRRRQLGPGTLNPGRRSAAAPCLPLAGDRRDQNDSFFVS
jgi:hypothetical protein